MMFVFCRQDPGAQSQGCKQPPFTSASGRNRARRYHQPELALIFTAGITATAATRFERFTKKQILAGFFLTDSSIANRRIPP
jgi:hypothetical protein